MRDLPRLLDKALNNSPLTEAEAGGLISTPDEAIYEMLSASERIVRKFKGKKIKLCSIINARSGRCSEDCSFCAQSAHHSTEVKIYDLVSKEDMVEAASGAEKNMRSTCFSIVTSGKSVNKEAEIESISGALKDISKRTKLNKCVSLGTIDREALIKLKEAGLTKLHHNLETAKSHFPKVCTTHSYDERLNTVKAAKEVGLKVCSGGIFNVGESPEQRVELGLALRELKVDSVPINILNPIPGTPAAAHHTPIKPFDVLKLIITYRFLMPTADIGLFGGRELSLRELQPLMFAAGANVILIGDYLTTQGQAPEKDLMMISDLGLEIDDGRSC